MVEGRRSFSLALESSEGLRVVGEFFRQELQRDVATELEVLGLIHHAHAPAPDPAQDAVVGNRLPHGLGGRGHWQNMLGVYRGKAQRRSFVCCTLWFFPKQLPRWPSRSLEQRTRMTAFREPISSFRAGRSAGRRPESRIDANQNQLKQSGTHPQPVTLTGSVALAIPI